MIRRGKKEGWLQLPEDAFVTWAELNNVSFHHAVPGAIAGRGRALLANAELNKPSEDTDTILLTVPRDMILSLERVQEHVKVDQYFREFLDSLGDFGRVGRLHRQHAVYQQIISSLCIFLCLLTDDMSVPTRSHPFIST